MSIRRPKGTTLGKGTPKRTEGQNGDITIRSTSAGTKMYAKSNNKWHIKSNTSKNISVSILNTNGLLVYESIININEGNNTTTIPLNGLKRGLYLINILDLTTNNVEVRKIIINN